MKQRTLGTSGLLVSEIGLGCNNFGGRVDVDASRRIVHKALDLGITLFDTADIYGRLNGGDCGASEEQLGQILSGRRHEIVLATKFGMAMDERSKGASRRYIMSAVEASLKRLKTDWIDLYQVHQPDPQTPIEETLRALDDLVRHGKVRYIGCSNFAAWQVVEAAWTARHHGHNAFISCQDEYSLLVRDLERERLPVIERYGLGLLPFFPLASGLLTGKYKREAMPENARISREQRYATRYLSPENWQKLERLERFCAARGRSLLQLAFSWLLARPAVGSVIAGATRPEQVEQNIKAGDWALTAAELAEIDALTKG
ncbi:MAG TPA: aldo/keto reductase [Stellaceae bacterium]|nr:aldo/keto reductase [Stellaceae bacterium]